MQLNEPPSIGISTCCYRTADDELKIGVAREYIESIIAAGGVPILIPVTQSLETVAAIYSRCSGLLITGGEDVSPQLYGENPHEKIGPVCESRDEIEKYLILSAKEEQKPVLGICRGMQIINVVLGGTLFQDLETQCSIKGHSSKLAYDAESQAAHEIAIDEDSRLAAQLGRETIAVNSWHHQAIKRLAPGLRASARHGGLIEAVEAEGEWYCVGVQCHPESIWDKQVREWLNVFKQLVLEARGFERKRLSTRE
ncbi:MAG: gamma-glutamyl-gamma-aminobutyrate hydrolase family protein [Deltaproteobacteria bacterium]|nr:gamma-glutamyl-gamma-aminobutyrate hydrolase family protein [Deltaproteobacteria bacterium]